WPSSHLLLLHPPSHHKSQLTPPEQLPPSSSSSVNKHRTSMPRQSRQAFSAATNASSSTAGSSPPAASPAASTPPPASGAGSSASAGSSAAAAAAAGSPEQVPADREPQYLCPDTVCNTNLFFKENIHNDRADYPACRNFDAGTCAWTGLLIKYPGKVCWLCASEFQVGEVVWAYTTPDVERPACYINWCLNEDACIILKEEGVPVNVRLAGEDDVSESF
ncbi:unnamed protein product, partial [Ectocarpus sp. 6 AP-2014]